MTDNVKQNNITALIIEAGIDTALKELHTCLPGIVVENDSGGTSFDPITQTATIQPSIKKTYVDDDGNDVDIINLPVITDVPIRFPKSNKFSISFPLETGDEVLLIFAEQSLDTWHEYGGIQKPDDLRRHAMEDAFAIPMGYSQQNLIPNFPTENLEIKLNDGSGSISIAPDGTVSIVGTEIILNNGSNLAVQYEALQIAFDELQEAFNTHTHIYLPGPGTTDPAIPQSIADITTTKIDTIKVP